MAPPPTSHTASQAAIDRASWPESWPESWLDTAPGVWWVVAAFAVGTVASIVAWL